MLVPPTRVLAEALASLQAFDTKKLRMKQITVYCDTGMAGLTHGTDGDLLPNLELVVGVRPTRKVLAPIETNHQTWDNKVN
jgi:hypothetical protein